MVHWEKILRFIGIVMPQENSKKRLALFSEKAYLLIKKFESLGFNLGLSHAHNLIALYYGFESKRLLNLYVNKKNLLEKDLKRSLSIEKIFVYKSHLTAIDWSELSIDRITKMLNDTLNTNFYIVLPDDVHSLESKNLEVYFNDTQDLVMKYKEDYHDINYVNSVLGKNEFPLSDIKSAAYVQEYLTSCKDDAKDDYSVICYGETRFNTSNKAQMKELDNLLSNLD